MRHDFSQINRKKVCVVLLVCIVAIGMIFYFFIGKQDANSLDKGLVKPAVDIYVIERGDMMRRVSLFGQTVSEAHIDLAPKYSGRITEVNVKLGDRVQAGDVLMVQDTKDLALAIEQNHAAVRQAEADSIEAQSSYEANYQKAEADYERTKQNDDRYQALYREGAVSKIEYDSMHQEMINSKAVLDTLRNQTMSGEVPASVESKRATLVKTERGTDVLVKQQDDLVLRAPRGGVISFRAAEVGAIAQAGQKVLELVDNSRIYVDCQLSEQDVAAIQTGFSVQVNIESLGRSYDGKIIYISPSTGTDSKNYSVRIELGSADELIKEGMFARTQIEFLQRPQALFVPKESVIEKNGKTSVFIIDAENKSQERSVTLGLRNDTEVEILTGLNEGEMVATSNLARLRNGLAVDRGQAGEAS